MENHGAIPTGRFLYGCKYSDSPTCNYCGELDDLTHIFVTCSRLSRLFQIAQSLIRKGLLCIFALIYIYIYIICLSIFPTKQCNDMLCLCTVN